MTKPNIIFILIDDMGWMDIGCQGSSFYETPNIDRLRAQGMQFTDAYASCPVCSPTRASVLTGKYPATVGITNYIPGAAVGKLLAVPYFRELPRSETTVATALKRHGYRTFHVGKWHLGGEGHTPQDFGFDVNVAGCDWGAPRKGYFSPWQLPGYPDGVEGEYLTDHISDRAVELIDDAGDDPYFMYLSHYAVHTPIQAPAHLIAKYKAKAARLGLDKVQIFEEGEFHPCISKQEQRVKRRLVQSDPGYAAMVENLDANIGKVMAAVERSSRSDDTIIIFTSDNGGLATSEGSPTSNAPLAEGKGWMYEGGTREPMLVRWPKVVSAGSNCDVPVTSTDFFPTFLEAAGAPLMPEQHCDGVSILSLFEGKAALEREAIFWHYPHYSNQGGSPGCSVRAGDWKLIEFFEDSKLELYNLRDDISEERDRAADKPELVKNLHAKLIAWRESVEAKIPPVNEHYEAMSRGDIPVPSPWDD
ncbi:MAG: sulfatase [Planctomycetota bacterium]|jgi:arylsulfatase A-like enzyme|nr:sulfatase [Planctomycetota bacterium]